MTVAARQTALVIAYRVHSELRCVSKNMSTGYPDTTYPARLHPPLIPPRIIPTTEPMTTEISKPAHCATCSHSKIPPALLHSPGSHFQPSRVSPRDYYRTHNSERTRDRRARESAHGTATTNCPRDHHDAIRSCCIGRRQWRRVQHSVPRDHGEARARQAWQNTHGGRGPDGQDCANGAGQLSPAHDTK